MAKNNFRNTDRDNKGSVVKKKTTQISVSYNIPEVDDNVKGCSTVNSTSVNEYSGDIIYNVGTEESDAVVVGCNSNNDNSSARTVNSNNAVSNSNDNYAGRFALPERETRIDTESGDSRNRRRTCTTCSARTNKTEEVVEKFEEIDPNDLMGLLRDEYSNGNNASESLAFSPIRENNNNVRSTDIWKELDKANHKRHLKNLKRFLTNREIVTVAVERCLKRASKSKHRNKAIKHKEEIINRIIDELTNETYHVSECVKRKLPKRGKDGKERNANIFKIYDRCVQNVILLVIETKLKNQISRYIYSGLEGRSIFSNNKTYCLKNRIIEYCKKHTEDYVMMTDIRHFYESLSPEVVMSILFKTIKDRYTRILLHDILTSLDSLPIGGTLSQLFAMVVLSECDEIIMKKFRPTFYCGFGDNRLFGDKDKQKLIDIREFQISYYSGRFNLDLKGDYSLHKVSDGFRFCKTYFSADYTKIRAELRHRTIRGAIRGQQHYAGYKGILLKTDSKNLRRSIENNLYLLRHRIKTVDFNNKLNKFMDTMPTKLIGNKIKLNEFLGKKIAITNYEKKRSSKEEGNDFYEFQIIIPVMKDGKKTCHAYRSWNSSANIRCFFEMVEKGDIKLPIKTKVLSKGANSLYFEGYDWYSEVAAETIISELGDESLFEDDDFNNDSFSPNK